jgi:xanthine dehydrogenase accessory factor
MGWIGNYIARNRHIPVKRIGINQLSGVFMENLDVMVLRTLRDWRVAGRRALLATVVRTWGSSPRPIGSIMALCEDGSVVGSVSGGCIEDDLVYRYSQAYAKGTMPTGAPKFEKYGVTADEAHQFGLPCGGTLELVIEPDPDSDLLKQLVALLGAGKLVQRVTQLSDGAVSLTEAHAPAELQLTETALTNTFGPEYRMLLIGAGQLTEYLATMALFSGFAVTVCDPREEYRRSFNVAGAQMLTSMPDDTVTAFKPDRRSCVIALTHDPKLDDLALMEALKSEAFYVGAIGSRRNNEARHARMQEHFEVSAEELKNLKGPIGIYIGSKTPPEIAVSIMAEVLAVKNGVALPAQSSVAESKNQRNINASESANDQLVCAPRTKS